MFILITRGRPHGLKRFIDAYRDTHAGASVLLYFDNDDPELERYQALLYPSHWVVMVGPRMRPGPTYNFIFSKFPRDDYYGMLADDIAPLTDYWDEILVERAGKKEMAYPHDELTGEKIATHPVIGGDLVRAAGFLVYDGLQQYFADTWWTFVCKELGRAHYMPEVIYDHHHHSLGKSEVDDTYRGKWEHAESDRKIYDEFVAEPQGFLNIMRVRLQNDS